MRLSRKIIKLTRLKREIDMLNLVFEKYFYNLDYNEIFHIINYDSEIRGGNALQKPFTEIVDKILTITKDSDYLENSTKQAKVKEYERQIDQMVYQLYGMTEKEIKIIEGETKK